MSFCLRFIFCKLEIVSRKKVAFKTMMIANGIPKNIKLAKPLYIQQFLIWRVDFGFKIVEFVFRPATQAAKVELNRSAGSYALITGVYSHPSRNKA